MVDVLDRRPLAQEAERNGPCPCGSGAKFKKCCQPRLVYMRKGEDCMRAATATVLGIPYEDTPDVWAGTTDGQDAWVEWAEGRGLRMMRSTAPEAAAAYEWTIVGIEFSAPDAPTEKHALVAHDGELFHDPDRAGYWQSAERLPGQSVSVVDAVAFVPLADAPA